MTLHLRIWLCVVFYDRADTKIRFEIEVDAVNRWRVLDWMCLDGLLIRIT